MASSAARLAIADLRFAAWFLWMTPLLAALSRLCDAVRKATNNQQEPYTYGSIGGDLLYFANRSP